MPEPSLKRTVGPSPSLPSPIVDVVAVGGFVERRERVWSLIVKLLHFANMPPKEDSVGQRNDHCTGSNKVD
jgi:hypothetical protein